MMRPSAIITGAGSYYGGPAANTRAKTMQPLVAQKELGEMLFYEPSPEPDVEKYVARPADRRAMGLQFQWGAAAAGKALEQAGYTSREERENVALFVASRAGERDHDVDAAAVEELPAYEDAGGLLNKLLMERLRPTLFLRQIPNLLAGNLAIIFGTKGPSRTFLGEEAAGACAIEAACYAVAQGRSNQVLVGASLNAGRESLLRWLYASGAGANGEVGPIWAESHPKIILGGASAFLHLEGEASAKARSAEGVARVTWLGAYCLDWHDGTVAHDTLRTIFEEAERENDGLAVITNACAAPRIDIEREFWSNSGIPGNLVINSASLFGSTLEVDAPLCVATATAWLRGCLEHEITRTAALAPVEPPSQAFPKACLVLIGGREKNVFACLVEVVK